MLTEISRTEKDKYYMISPRCSTLKKKLRRRDQTCGKQKQSKRKGNWKKVFKSYKLPAIT